MAAWQYNEMAQPANPLRLFVSYARTDDRPPVEGEGRGFVSTLIGYLELRLDELGRPPNIDVWRDKRSIVPSEQFGPVIEAGIAAADVFLVVLSNNWLSSEWCNRELDSFSKRFHPEDDSEIKQRIVILNKHFLDPEKRPKPLRGQEGYLFFRPAKDEPGGFHEFFAFGKTRLPEFQNTVEALALDLWQRACVKANMRTPARRAEPKREQTRKVFVARPAGDMRAQYDSVVQELHERDFAVVPALDEVTPQDATAVHFFDHALTGAEAAIHLIGENAGFAPEGLQPIVQLQLQRSAARYAAASGFKRLIWAPARIDGAPERNPLDVMTQFGEKKDDDTVDGGELSFFIDTVLNYLKKHSLRTGALQPLVADARVYIYHQSEDTAYAVSIAKALREQSVDYAFPLFEGEQDAINAYHRRQLQKCDAVLVCWANAPEAFALSTIDEWEDWRDLGRDRDFSSRAIAVGPPKNVRKDVLLELPPRRCIDMVLDLTAVDSPSAKELAPLIHGSDTPR